MDTLWIQDDEGKRTILAVSRGAAESARRDNEGDETALEFAGWMKDIGWDTENYTSRREFESESGYSSWWVNSLPPTDLQAREGFMPAWNVVPASRPRSQDLFVRSDAISAMDDFQGMTISDRMISAAAQVRRLREAIEDHRRSVRAAGHVRVFDSASATRATQKQHADNKLWSLAPEDQ